MKEIQLTNGGVAIVDDEDYEAVAKYKWRQDNFGYALLTTEHDGRSGRMHQMILPIPKGLVCDHINCNRLDNRRNNLRLATHSQNHFNAPKKRNKRPPTSRYKGVYFSRSHRKWMVRLDKTYLGYFGSEEAAARAYDSAATERLGEFARTNVMLGLLPPLPTHLPHTQ